MNRITSLTASGAALALVLFGGCSGGASTQPAPQPPDTTAPAVPQNLAGASPSPTVVHLTWSTSTDSGGAGLAGYRIYRNGSATPLASTTAAMYSDTTVVASTTYQYRVSAYDAAMPPNESAQSTQISVTTAAIPDTTPPTVPQNLTATATSPTRINLAWSASTDAGGSGLAGYRIHRNGSASVFASTTATSLSDTTVVAGTTYSYTVQAYDNASPANVSAPSNTAQATTPASVYGLDTRPSNTTCVAPARPVTATFTTPRVFTNLSFSLPVLMLQAPGDASRWYVVEQAGRVKMFNNNAGVTTSSTVLDIAAKAHSPVSGGNNEEGLLGMAFHPNFASNHFAYLFYTNRNDGKNHLVRFTSPDNGATLDPASELDVLTIDKPYGNHNGGNVVFGPDGYLYMGFGDGGSRDDPNNYAQNTHILLGKIIRIDVNQGTPGTATPYGIPADNPFASGSPALCNAVTRPLTRTTNCPEIYAYGVRNPWRWSFDAGNGDLWLGDVGQDNYEEVDKVVKGGNYGWRCREGLHATPGVSQAGCPAISAMIDPVAEYTHNLGNSITGGYVYRGTALSGFSGNYVFADFGTGMIWALTPDGSGGYNRIDVTSTGKNISSFAQGPDNELYFISYGDGAIHALQSGGGTGGTIPTMLSATGCFNAAAPSQPTSGLIPFLPNVAFWSDGAGKARWFAVPDSQTIDLAADGDFLFPPGSVLVKSFSLNSQLIETRLFMRHPDGVWAGYTYEWNSAQTDATLVPAAGKTKTINGQTWLYPSQNQCLECHKSAANFSLGIETRQLNGDMLYPLTNRTANQMVTLAHIGMFSSTPPTLSALPDPFGTDTLNNRARAYLHENCAGCHRPNSGVPSNMDLRYTTALSATNACDADPQAGSFSIPNAKLIAPGNASASIVVLRMSRRPPDAGSMPPLASYIPDTNGVALITDWINGLQSCN